MLSDDFKTFWGKLKAGAYDSTLEANIQAVFASSPVNDELQAAASLLLGRLAKVNTAHALNFSENFLNSCTDVDQPFALAAAEGWMEASRIKHGAVGPSRMEYEQQICQAAASDSLLQKLAELSLQSSRQYETWLKSEPELCIEEEEEEAVQPMIDPIAQLFRYSSLDPRIFDKKRIRPLNRMLEYIRLRPEAPGRIEGPEF